MKKSIITSRMFILIGILFCNSIYAQKAKNDTVFIKTSAECEQCKTRIEKALVFEKGVKDVHVDYKTKIATIIYNKEKTSPEKIRVAISKSGYDADDVKAEEKAYKKLPECCKKEGMKQE